MGRVLKDPDEVSHEVSHPVLSNILLKKDPLIWRMSGEQPIPSGHRRNTDLDKRKAHSLLENPIPLRFRVRSPHRLFVAMTHDLHCSLEIDSGSPG